MHTCTHTHTHIHTHKHTHTHTHTTHTHTQTHMHKVNPFIIEFMSCRNYIYMFLFQRWLYNSCCAYQYLIFYLNKTSYEKPAVKCSSLKISIVIMIKGIIQG